MHEGMEFIVTKDEFGLINKAANEVGLMAHITRIDHDEDEIDFILVKRNQQ